VPLSLKRRRDRTPGKLPKLSEVFVVPQRIHMVLGTLADQITYPTLIKKEDRTEAINAELTQVCERPHEN
jgi:ABC-type uncharacterized transport system fused permease/ATPase subunit